MSKLADKFAAGRKALVDTQGGETPDAAAAGSPSAPVVPSRASGPLHGSISTMKMEMLTEENKQLRAGTPILKLDATTIRPSIWANRHDDSFNSKEFEEFKAEILSEGGNVQPIKVRPILATDGQFKYEIVFGHRRHRACLDLGLPVNAFVEEVDEKSLFIQMERENRGREDLRPFEQGQHYARALDMELFPSVRKMAEESDVDASNISKALAIARLPAPVLECFVSPLDIQFRWGAELKSTLEKEPDVVLARAGDIKKARSAGDQISSKAALAMLLGKVSATVKTAPRTVSVGNKAFTIVEKNKKVAIRFDALGKDKQARIEKFIAEVMAE